MDKNTIGQRIRNLRIEKGLSQEELATKLGYKSRSTINKIELGINEITQTKVVEFAKILGVTPAYLMGWENKDWIIASVFKSKMQMLYDKYGFETIRRCFHNFDTDYSEHNEEKTDVALLKDFAELLAEVEKILGIKI